MYILIKKINTVLIFINTTYKKRHV